MAPRVSSLTSGTLVCEELRITAQGAVHLASGANVQNTGAGR